MVMLAMDILIKDTPVKGIPVKDTPTLLGDTHTNNADSFDIQSTISMSVLLLSFGKRPKHATSPVATAVWE
jgi:hypothetical protein